MHGTVHDIDGGRGRAAIKLQAKSDLLHCHGRRRRSADSSSRSKPERGPGQTACPLARPERKRPQNAPKSGAVGTSRRHRKSLQTAEFSADGCLDRTQEVGGSSPPSSTRRPPRACGGFFVWGTACSREPDRLGRRLPSECLLGASGEATAHGRGRVSSLDPDDAAADTPRRGPTMRNGNVSPGVSATSGCAATVPRNDGPRHALRADHFVLGRRWPGCGEWSSDEVIL